MYLWSPGCIFLFGSGYLFVLVFGPEYNVVRLMATIILLVRHVVGELAEIMSPFQILKRVQGGRGSLQ
jgi:hypothetical protein